MFASQLDLHFASRFLDVHAGPSIMRDPVTALVELVANAWDAGATEVQIRWPDEALGRTFSISDNGHGMTEAEFEQRWLTLSYDRRAGQGLRVQFPADVKVERQRPAFGRNGIGRHAMFCFGDSYIVRTWRDGWESSFRVRKGTHLPLDVTPGKKKARKGHGTVLEALQPRMIGLTAQAARAEVGMRFLTDPSFIVVLDGEKISFDDLPDKHIARIEIDGGDAGPISILVVDTRDTDRTTHQHGVAWHVNGRLVGNCTWDGTGHEKFLDGRRSEAKRYTFIVSADGLAHAVSKDWRRFNHEDASFAHANGLVQDAIRSKLLELTAGKRAAMAQAVRETLETSVAKLTPLSRERWTEFVDGALVACPSISEKELCQLAGVLAKLEDACSQYGLLSQLDALDSADLDDLHKILSDWTLRFAKLVLDEVQSRLRLVDELHRKVVDHMTKEVQELQPLFKRGLWIFGPEFETIEYTSNVGMTKVIQSLFGGTEKASLNRPDFAVLTDSSVGLYSYPSYDGEGGEIGIDRLTIVELKKPGVIVGTDEKGQAWKYVKELYDRGHLQDRTTVTCFVLGSVIDPNENGERTEKNGRVSIRPLLYDTVLSRAKSRMLKLYDRVKDAPFLDQELEKFLDGGVTAPEQMPLSLQVNAQAVATKE
jgi:hypothetical protein